MSNEPTREAMSTEDTLWPTSSTTTTTSEPTTLYQSGGLRVTTVATQAPAAPGQPDTPEARPSDADVLYPRHPLENVFDRRSRELWTQLDLNESEQQELRQQYVGLARATGWRDDVMQYVTELDLDRAMAPEVDEATREQRVKQDNTEAREAILSRFGEDGPDLWERVQRMVRDYPAAAAVLRAGLGPKAAWLAIELAEEVRRRGVR